MLKIPDDYLEKVYAGLLGKTIGVRLGAPVEPEIWTHDKIKEIYGDVNGYLKDYRNFAADDDTNGTIFFIRALKDYSDDGKISAEDIGNTWLNYTCEGHGMFWWGGYGISTEHTAYLNLKNGIKAPMSGSIARNGLASAEQIGGQIFIDGWGLVCPGNPSLAAEYASKAASVAHDGNGIYGGMFIAACISQAFVESDIEKVIKNGLSVIPNNCEYTKMAKDVIAFYKKRPHDFRASFRFIESNYGYDRYPGICHIIPNAAVVILSLLYGKGDFSNTIEIATMCGWDTDCNAGNVGTILGVVCGTEKIGSYWRKPINDIIIASNVIGSLNIIDVPTLARGIAALGYKIAKEEVPARSQKLLPDAYIYYDFNLPGSTHGFRLSNERKNSLVNTDEMAFAGGRCLRAAITDLRKAERVNIFIKPFYRRADFDDERYRPAFSPTVFAGQTISVRCFLKKDSEFNAWIAIYARTTDTKKTLFSKPKLLEVEAWTAISFQIPDTDAEAIDEVGISIENTNKSVFVGRLYIDEFKVTGKARYKIDFTKERAEFGGVTQFTYNGGHWSLEDGKMVGMTSNKSESYTGHHKMRDYILEATVIPKVGDSHNVNFRVKGTLMSYAVGFDGEGRVSLFKNEHGYKRLCTVDYCWNYDEGYIFRIKAMGNSIEIYLNNVCLFNYEDIDKPFLFGGYGFSQLESGRTQYGDIRFEEQ